MHLEPVLHKRRHHSEKPVPNNKKQLLLTHTLQLRKLVYSHHAVLGVVVYSLSCIQLL